MSTQVIGALFAALVLKNTPPFTFYCYMTAICFLASLFFLFLKPVQAEEKDSNVPEGDEEEFEEPLRSTKEDILETLKMVMNKRIMMLYPTMILTALNLGIFASTFINLMTATMDDPKATDSTSNALLCMLGLGTGEIIGSLVFGRITDKLPHK